MCAHLVNNCLKGSNDDLALAVALLGLWPQAGLVEDSEEPVLHFGLKPPKPTAPIQAPTPPPPHFNLNPNFFACLQTRLSG